MWETPEPPATPYSRPMTDMPSPEGPGRFAAAGRAVWRSAQIAAATLAVSVPFGFAATGEAVEVTMGAVCGVAVGVGLGLRLGERNGRSVGILVGSALGAAATLLAGRAALSPGWLVPPLLALALGLMDGLGSARLRGYRESLRESLLISLVLGFGALFGRLPVSGLAAALACAPVNALVAGFFGRDPDGRRFTRPPWWLLLAVSVMFAAVAAVTALDGHPVRPIPRSLGVAAASLLLVPAAVFLAARTAAVWLRPRLRVYSELADYLRVMWVPIGGFAVGYLAIIVLFAGFAGALERFLPGSFTGADAAELADWVLFSFYSAVAQPYSAISPATGPARLLHGAQLVLSVGWALVVFAAVMSAIQPQLERIARRRKPPTD